MKTQEQTYGDLIRLDPDNDPPEETLQRIPLGTSVANGGIDESSLQDLLFRFPRTLPIAAIDAAYAGAVPVCRELSTPAGYVDALYVNPLGRLTLAEFKLWRNPQARREVIGQILDYTQEIASWSYEDLQREVSKTLKKKGNVLYELIRKNAPEVNEAEFVDNITRHLKRGEFLLLIIGDGIREGVENIVNFVQRYGGLHFNLALVEAALYRDKANRIIIQPRILMRTEIVGRIVTGDGVAQGVLSEDDEDDVLSDYQQENLRFWTAVLDGYSFSDVTVEVPAVGKESMLYVKVRNSGFGDWGLSFVGFISRGSSLIGCYLSCRKDIPQAVRIHEEIKESFEELQRELGDDLLFWKNKAGRPRIGFKRPTRLPFVAGDGESYDFDEVVVWMRDRLDRLVTTLQSIGKSKIYFRWCRRCVGATHPFGAQCMGDGQTIRPISLTPFCLRDSHRLTPVPMGRTLILANILREPRFVGLPAK